jgi:5-methyltetrahydropteroyltriglutamate--homocysteine methyltransferase
MDRILATHTGSLIRPPGLLEFLAAKDAGRSYDEEAYQRTLKEAVADQVRRQVDAGIDVVNDGEMGKAPGELIRRALREGRAGRVR